MSSNGAPCNICGQWVMPNTPHFCQWQMPAYPAAPAQPPPMFPPAGVGPLTWPPPALSLDDIRKVVREEVEAALTKALGAPTAVAPDPTSGYNDADPA